MPKYKALVVNETQNNTFTLNIQEKDTNELERGQVLIRVKYSSLNYKDALSCSGHRGITKEYPHTPGIDAAGVVIECKSPLFEVSDEVIVTGFDLGMNTPGGFAEYIVVPFDWVVRKPDELSFFDAMTYGTAGFTAALSIEKCIRNGLRPSMGPVLVTGATGGVGSLSVGILARLGYHVVALSGKANKKDFLLSLGAREVIGRDEVIAKPPLVKEKWAGVIDCVGGDILVNILKACMQEASCAISGMVSSTDIKSTIYPFILRGVNLLGITSQSHPINQRYDLWKRLAVDWKFDMALLERKECGLKDIENEVKLMLEGKQSGRVIINPNM